MSMLPLPLVHAHELSDQARQVLRGNTDARIGHGRITFSPSLTGTLAEIMQYSFPVDGTGIVKKDMPEDANNHYMDALRYAITGVDGIGLQPDLEQDVYGTEEIIPGFAPVRLGAA